MICNWRSIKLGDIIDLVIDYRGKTPKKLGGDWSPSGYRALSAKNIKTGKIVSEETIRYVDESIYKKWMKDEIKRGDIFITSEVPFGQVYYWDSDEKIVLSQRLFALRIKKEYNPKVFWPVVGVSVIVFFWLIKTVFFSTVVLEGSYVQQLKGFSGEYRGFETTIKF